MTIEPTHSDYALSVSLDPFSNTVWKSPAARDHYGDLLRRAAAGKADAEWRSVADSDTDRKAAIVHVDHRTRDDWLQRVGEHDLAYRHIRDTAPYGGFAHSFSPVEGDDPERVSYAAVAETEDVADKMYEAEIERSGWEKHNLVGELLGFPECCREHFYDWFIDAGVRDPVYETACNSPSAEAVDGDHNHVRVPEAEPAVSPLFRYFGYSFVTHIPCSLECEGSLEVARDRYRLMAEHGYHDAADALHEWLSLPAEWTSYKRIAEVRNRHYSGAALGSAHVDKKTITFLDEHESVGQTPGGSDGSGESSLGGRL